MVATILESGLLKKYSIAGGGSVRPLPQETVKSCKNHYTLAANLVFVGVVNCHP
jgi:hypothetical protein